jgi:type IV pilus assembly protein PilO
MPALAGTRKRLGIAFAIMALVCVVALAILASPLVRERSDDITQLQIQRTLQQQQVDRVGDIDKKIAEAGKQIADFYKDRLPTRDSAISDSLGKMAAESGVKLEQVKYGSKEAVPAGLRPLEIEASLSGQYPQLARFLNSVERNQPVFFIVDSIDLGGEQNGIVRLQVKLRTFSRAGA